MSDPLGKSTDSGFIAGSTSQHSVTRPKFQPIRLKALQHFGESDEDDDDDRKFQKSKDKSYDEPQPLPQDESIENILQQSSLPKKDLNSEIDTQNKFSMHDSLKESHKAACDIPYLIDKPSCTTSNEVKSEVNIKMLVNDGIKLATIENPIEKSNKSETYRSKNVEKVQDCNDYKSVSKNQQTDTAYEQPINVAVPPVSLYKGDHNVNSDANRNLQLTSDSRQSLHEDTYVSDILSKKKEDHVYMLAESKKLLGTNRDSFLLNMSKEDKQHKQSTQSLTDIEKNSKDREEEYHCRISNVEAESINVSQSTTSGNVIHPTVKCSQYNVAKYEGNEKYVTTESKREFSTPSLSNVGKASSINRVIIETPMKHSQLGAVHPNPCTSHKQLFCTPQNKPSSNANKCHIQTPSTILSSWYHNMGHTPMEGKSHVVKDSVQAYKNVAYTPVMGKGETSRPYVLDTKSARRPLMDAKLIHGDSSIYSLEKKPLISQKLPETKCITSESQQDDRGKKTIGLSEVKLMQTEVNYDKDIKSTNSVEETKENNQPNLPDVPSGNKETVQKQVIIGSNTGLKVIHTPVPKYSIDDNVVSNTECKKSQDCERQREIPRQIANKVGNVQFSVPCSSISQQRQRKTLVVKDKEYLILGSLGQGMSGEVLRVQDLSCGELRAIKCVNFNKMDKESAQGCLDEISMLHKLQAPCVIRMFDYHIKQPMIYVVMEMGDTDLSSLLKSTSQEKQLPLTMILYYWTEMLTAVKHIHDNGVIHSDLKPANFLLVRGRLKLIDFGIASNINSDMTSVLKNNSIGTLNYISPEALMDIGGNTDSPTHNVKYKISFKSDVWSLGCILYSLVYGHTPFHHIRSQWAKVTAITNPKPNISFSTGESQGCNRAPPVLIDVMRKCLQHDPKARPTVSQLLAVQYVPTKQNIAVPTVPTVPTSILMKIRHTLNEEEWRQLIQVLDTNRAHHI